MQFSFPDGTGSFKCSGIVCAQEDVSKLFFYANNVLCTLLEMVVIFFLIFSFKMIQIKEIIISMFKVGKPYIYGKQDYPA